MILNRDIYILLFIAIVSSTFAFIVHEGETDSERQAIRLLTAKSPIHFDAIQSITLQKNGKVYEFNRLDLEWWMTSPYQIRMNTSSMSALIRVVQGSQVIGVFADGANRKVIGLGDQSDSISMSDGNEVVSIRLGRKTLGGRAYAQIGDEEPVIIDQSLHRRAIDMDYRLWRDLRFFPDFAIDGIRIERIANTNRLVLDRTSGRWEMVYPVKARVDQEVLLEWVGKLASIRVGSFVIDAPNDLALFGLDNPVASFSVRNQAGITHELLIGGRVSAGSQDRYVMMAGRPIVDKVKWEALSELFLQPELLVDATGSAVSRFDVKQITVRSDGNEFRIQRRLEQWVNENGVPVNIEDVDALLTWVLDSNPPRVVIAQYPRDVEIATITLEGYDLLPLDTVRIAQDPESAGLILENGDNVLRLHPAESLTVLSPFIQKK